MAGWKEVYKSLRSKGVRPLSAFFLAWDIRRNVPDELQSEVIVFPVDPKEVQAATHPEAAELFQIIHQLKVEQRLDKLLGRRWQTVYGPEQTFCLIALFFAAAEESGRHDLLDPALHPGMLEWLALSGRRVRGLVEGICRQADPEYQISEELRRRYPVLDQKKS